MERLKLIVQNRRFLVMGEQGQSPKAFHQIPGYAVFYQVLTRLDSAAFAALLSGWLQARAGLLPLALALDGKMIRDHLGLLTLAQHEDGAPQAVAIYDQKEGTERCCSAAALLTSLPALDDKLVTADACTARKRPPGPSRKREATICSKSRATSRNCSPRPRR